MLLGCAETAEHFHLDREWRQALAEGMVVLLSQDGCGYQDRHLLAVHHRFESRP